MRSIVPGPMNVLGSVDDEESVALTCNEVREISRSFKTKGNVAALRAARVEALVAHVPCWTAPNLVLHGVQSMGLPTILLSNKSAATHGTVGLLGAGGALDQIGYRHLRVREDFDGPALAGKVLPFVRAGPRHRVKRVQLDRAIQAAEEGQRLGVFALGQPAEDLLPFVRPFVANRDQAEFRGDRKGRPYRSFHAHFSMCRGKPWIERPPSG